MGERKKILRRRPPEPSRPPGDERCEEPPLNAETVDNLLAINRRFYDRFATSFSDTRQRPWRGWDRVLEHLPGSATRALSVLDVGCGNGRFAAFLADHQRPASRFVGLDNSSRSLLEVAQRSCSHLPDHRFQPFELITQSLAEVLDGERFDVIVLFGVLHHVPGLHHRRNLLRTLGRHLAPDGGLVATAWLRDRYPGFEHRTVPWTRYNLRCRQHPGAAGQPIDRDQLETGDFLLTWKELDDTPRYCHFPDDAEIHDWVQASGLGLRTSFEADGRTGRDNRYLILTPRT